MKSEALKIHEELKGKIEIKARADIHSKAELALLYSPGVSEPCLAIQENPDLAYVYTRKHNTVAVISDGTAVLGLGDIGPLASLPVMEGKALLFKRFGNVDAIPILLDTKDIDEIVETIVRIAPSFGGINLEDISAPRCFIVEERLKERLDIPVFHDDQHGTAIVLAAALINALKLVKKPWNQVKVVLNGAGAAGTTIAKFLLQLGVKDLLVCDRHGILSPDDKTLSPHHLEIAQLTNPNQVKGTLVDAIKDRDVFIGVSAPHVVSRAMVQSMNDQAIVFPLANPIGEIDYEDAKAAGAYIVGTGSSRYPNQINNVLAFPGLFRGVLDARKKAITTEMMINAAYALADTIPLDELNPDYIIPDPFDERAHLNVSQAMKK
ncbi:MAG: NADP-dependent malic enzyme [Acholeplasmataceae bacterium]